MAAKSIPLALSPKRLQNYYDTSRLRDGNALLYSTVHAAVDGADEKEHTRTATIHLFCLFLKVARRYDIMQLGLSEQWLP